MIQVEGRLRCLGDGYEWAALYVDEAPLTEHLPDSQSPEIWIEDFTAPYNEKERQRFACAVGHRPRLWQAQDWGRARITIELMEEEA